MTRHRQHAAAQARREARERFGDNGRRQPQPRNLHAEMAFIGAIGLVCVIALSTVAAWIAFYG